MKKLILSLFLVATMVFGAGFAMTKPVNADDGGCGGGSAFFALKPWYAGQTMNVNGKCEIRWPAGNDIPVFVWSIVLNVLYDISMMVGYIAVVMVAWGGYLYMFSRGEPGRAEKGKKTLISAIIGLMIAMLSGVIMNTIAMILTRTS